MSNTKHKRGDVRSDGMVFWLYGKSYLNGQYWVTKVDYDKKIINSRRLSMNDYRKHKNKRRESNKAWNERNKNRRRDKELKRLFGVGQDWFNDRLSDQHGVCAICGNPETAKRSGKIVCLAVDHCHASGKNRGLLCMSCNTGLGYFKDSCETLLSAVSYLRLHAT